MADCYNKKGAGRSRRSLLRPFLLVVSLVWGVQLGKHVGDLTKQRQVGTAHVADGHRAIRVDVLAEREVLCTHVVELAAYGESRCG